jgi:HAMP domain-containing protein
VVLLNSKNQATLNELKAVKSEFNKMKQEYDKVMRMLEQKKEK